MNFFEHQQYHLVGIKGVAMTSLAQLLLDAGKTVTGCDVAEEFVTQKLLTALHLDIDHSFDTPLPSATECVVYTAAHQGKQNPQVQAALQKNLPVFTHAEALAAFFNQKKGIAVCGVGGKSTVTAMITWILGKSGFDPSYSVGVGNVIGLNKTGQWHKQSAYFVAEADEYVTDPAAVQQGEAAVPRFSFLKPQITVCTHLQFDHPDVYRDEAHTIATFNTFFSRVVEGGNLIINIADKEKVSASVPTLTFGDTAEADVSYHYDQEASREGHTAASIRHQDKEYHLELQVPGSYNVENAAAALLAAQQAGVPLQQGVQALQSFQSTARRFERIGEWNGVPLYDDYAHHPNEITAVLSALKSWYPSKRRVVAFQPHTYSRTKALFQEFTSCFSDADVVLVLDIFASAREAADGSVTSAQLVAAIQATFPQKEVLHLTTPHSLGFFCKTFLQPNDVFLTLGAGDIYHVYHYLLQDTVLQHSDKNGSAENETELQKLFQRRFSQLNFQAHHKLAPYTTVKIGGPAELFAQVSNKQDLIDISSFAHSHNVAVTVLGWGANSLISDQGITGLVIKNNCQGITVHDQAATQRTLQEYQSFKVLPRWNAAQAPEAPSYGFADIDYSEEGAERVLVTLDSGVSLPAAINTLLAQGITGLQWYTRIPASVGGAIYNNIHGGTHFIGEVLVAVEVLTETNELKRYTVDQLELEYDFSRFHHSNEVILSADFMLYKGDVARAQTTAIEWAKRKSVQPQNSLGCVFQNITAEQQQRLEVPTPSIGYLIQHVLKLQGYQVGDAKVSERHAAFIENLGSATAEDYLTIIKKIVEEAKNIADVTLETEIFFLGFTDQELNGIVHSRSKEGLSLEKPEK